MLRVFNCGIGMAVVTAAPEQATEMLNQWGETVFRIGRIEAHAGPAGMRFEAA